MAKTKTIFDYESEIRMMYDKRDDTEIQKKLNNRLTSWASLVEVTVFVANNEQKSFTRDEIGYSTVPMPTKRDSGMQQVADYQALLRFSPFTPMKWCTTLVERKGGKKGCEDVYGTLMNADGRERFYNEIARFKADSRFKRMVILAECSLPDFLNYIPPFCGKSRNSNHIGACAESRYGTIASLFVQDVPVLFCGTRYAAAKIYHKLIQQDIIKNYEYYLELDKGILIEA